MNTDPSGKRGLRFRGNEVVAPETVFALRAALLAGFLLLGMPAAEADTDDDARSLIGNIELGLGQVEDDSYAFGRYRGLASQGAFLIGNFDLSLAPGGKDYMHAQGRALGLSSRALKVAYGEQGRYDLLLQYKQLPNLRVDSAQTPYQGAGSTELVYTPVFRDLDLETERKQVGAKFSYRPDRHWSLSVDMRREVKQGTDVIAGALGGTGSGSGSGSGLGNTHAALLPEPVDYVTHLLDLKLGYVQRRYQWQLSYHMSLFENDAESLTWDHPGGGAAQGRLALPPDNQFHQVSLSGAYVVSDKTRLTGLLSSAWMLQDDDFLPYSIANPAVLPYRDSLDAEVRVYAAGIGLTTRPMPALRLRANYRYDERDNNTPQDTYDYSRLDSSVLSGFATNRPSSDKKHRFDTSVDYRFNRYFKTGLGYEYRKTERTYSDVEQNTSHTLDTSLRLAPMDELNMSLKLSRMRRDTSNYQAEISNQNPLLRKYYLADVTQDKLGFSLSYMPHYTLTLGLGADLVKDDYDATLIGLTKGKQHSYSMDLSYVPDDDVSWYGFYTRERNASTQRGSDDGALWQAGFDDEVDTFGVGAKFADAFGKFDIGVDYVYMDGSSDIDLSGGGLVSPQPYPSLINKLQSIRLYAEYPVRKNMDVQLSFLHERYDSDDWALDGLAADAINELLLLGNDSADYSNNVISAFVRYHF